MDTPIPLVTDPEVLADPVAAEDRYQLPTYAHLPLVLVRGEGARVWDVEGRAYWDFYGGHAVALLGHGHPRLVEAIATQARALTFYSNQVYCPVRAAAAKAIVSFAPSHLRRVFFCNSGAEANEVALKLARGATGRTQVVAMHGGFHGRTAGALSVTGIPRYRDAFPPGLGHVRFVSFGDLGAAAAAINGEVAAVILEPIQSMAGVVAAPSEFYRGLRDLCDRAGAKLIFDEVQTGWGRLGAPFAADLFGVAPDLITSAKGVAGGFPMGVVLVDDAIAATVKRGDQGTTFGGGPMACAAALAVQEAIAGEGLVARAREVGLRARESLGGVAGVGQVRGAGCLLGLALHRDAAPVASALRERGFLLGGSDDPRVLRLIPPLTLPFEALDSLRDALAEVLA